MRFAGVVLFILAAAQEVPALGSERPVLPAVRALSKPVIDGLLEERVWLKAQAVTEFYATRYDRPISRKTVARLAYDDEYVYAAFYCYDDPSQITASETKRGGSFSCDDYVCLELDTYAAGDRSYKFYVNPLGTQDDSMLGGSAGNIRWRGDWEAAAKIGDDGWTVEMAIPLRMLRYPDAQDTFGVGLMRKIQRNLETGYWPRELFIAGPRAAACWTGLSLPSPRRPWSVMPYLALDAREDDSDVYFGVDVKKSFQTGLSLALTHNPDFRNIETEVLGIDFSYEEKTVAESRPFFAEGKGYFPSNRLFYSRRIEEIDFGGKLFGEIGGTEIGFLDAISPGGRNDAVASIHHSITDAFSIEADAVSRTEPGITNTAGYVALGARQDSPDHYISGKAGYAFTTTAGEGGDGHVTTLNVTRAVPRGAPGFSAGITLEEISPEFNPLDGYVPSKDIRSGKLYTSYRRAYDAGKLEEWSLTFSVAQYDRTDGDFFRRDTDGTVSMDLRDSLGFSFGYSDSNRDVGYTVHDDGLWHLGTSWNRNIYRREGQAAVTFGRLASADYFFASAEQEFQITQKLAFQVRGQHRSMKGERTDEQTQGIAVLNYDFTPERGMSGRIVATEDDFNAYLAYRQRTRRGLDIFAGIGDPNASEWTDRLALKVAVCLEL